MNSNADLIVEKIIDCRHHSHATSNPLSLQ
jgi:hypothetical protein